MAQKQIQVVAAVGSPTSTAITTASRIATTHVQLTGRSLNQGSAAADAPTPIQTTMELRIVMTNARQTAEKQMPASADAE